MISKLEMINIFILSSKIIIMMLIFSKEICILLLVIWVWSSIKENYKNLLILTSLLTSHQVSQNHSIFSSSMNNNFKIQVLILKQSSINIMNLKLMKKFQCSQLIMSIWEKLILKKLKISNQIILKMLIFVEVLNHLIAKILTFWDKLLRKSLNKNGLKITFLETIITLLGSLFNLLKKCWYYHSCSIKISWWKHCY